MKHAITLIALLAGHCCFAQCPFVVALNNTGSPCLGAGTLVVSTKNTLSKIMWYNGNTVDTTVAAAIVTAPVVTTVAGGNGRGSAANQFNLPDAIFVDGSGNLYVSDESNNRVQKFPPGSTSATNGQTAAGGNGIGKNGNQFQPNSVCVDASGYMYVADNANARILKFPPGSTGATMGTTVAGGNGAGNGANQFVNPVSVFVDSSGNIFVVDAINDRVQKFAPGAASGVTAAGGNAYGSRPNQFNGPACVHVDGVGDIFVADAANNRIQKFLPGATNGITVAGGNGFGTAKNQLSTPSSVWVDDSGYIYAADVNNERVQKFPPGSNSTTDGKTVAGGAQGNGPYQFSGPNSVCVDKQGNIFVCDVGNNRVQKYSPQPVAISVIDTVLIPSAAGTYTALVTDTAGCAVTTNAITISPQVVPGISIQASADVISSCIAPLFDTIRFSAIAMGGGAAPIYKWQVNGIDSGANSPIFIAALAKNDIVTCSLVSNAACAATPTVTSGNYTVTFGRPPLATLNSKGGGCLGSDTVLFNSSATLSNIVWYNENTVDNTMISLSATAYLPVNAGTYTAVVTGSSGCIDTTNAIIINPVPSVTVAGDKTVICSGSPVTFTAVATNAGTSPVYRWQVNGQPAGASNAAYSSSTLVSGDAVNCIISATGANTCTGVSNTVVANVKPLPVAGAASDASIQLGQSITLQIPVTGDIASYLWMPPTGLSSDAIAAPVATPAATTTYMLTATSVDGCTATGVITVKVSSKIMIPGAFTPNDDAHNDVFYIIGGEEGDKIRSFSIYNRSGQKIFDVQNVVPNAPAFGWNGYYKNKKQPPGGYIYIAVITSANGTEKVYKGTVVLIR